MMYECWCVRLRDLEWKELETKREIESENEEESVMFVFRVQTPSRRRGCIMQWGPKACGNGLVRAHHQERASARPFQDLSREHQVLGRGRTKAIARMRGPCGRTKMGAQWRHATW
ncbi:hypothetical protein PIB30_098853 [Stylosanthes scabra]|uniref:Uncharacterized protein n=1 Tax=Stylosanthes scabra TaxID=79078 RepID=A0ABU6VV56_9FABA|nr:hypothetical protein [Stylosanthes scabra]